MSLWRKRKTSDKVATDVHHNEQKQDTLPVISIKSNDLSIRLWVDPPEGWRYGFPAIYDPASDGVMRDWIISKGYPAKLIQEYGDSWAVRCWSAKEPH
jgi:hypothetical protein